MLFRISRQTLFLFLILALAAFFRFWQLDEIPPGLYPDVAINGNEAITNPGHVFYPENNGREGLMINLISLSFSLFGISILSIKIVAAFFGTLTILGTYLLTNELFSDPKSQITNHKSQTNPNRPNPKLQLQVLNLKSLNVFGIWNLEFGISRSETIALLSSFFLATSFWHVNFSRIGFRAILLPFILTFSFWLLWKGFRAKNLVKIIFGGLLFGLGFYTYTSFRMAVFLLAVFLFLWLLQYRRNGEMRRFLLFCCSLLCVIFFTALPIGIYFLEHPADFASRAAPISIFAQENPLKAFGESLLRHLAMFTIYGDPNWRHNPSGLPQLSLLVSILFLIGLTKVLKELLWSGIGIIQHLQSKTVFQSINAQTPQYLFLLSWFFIMLLPGALTYEGIPHALRTIGVIPVPYIFAAIGGWYVWQSLSSSKKIHKKLLSSLAIVFLTAIAFLEYDTYFIKWGQSKEVEGAFTKQYVEIGNYLNSLSENTKKYVIVNEPGVPVPLPDGIPMPAQTIMFIEWTHPEKPPSTYLKKEELSLIPSLPNTVIVPMRYEEELFHRLQELFPTGKPQKENGIWVFHLD
jgi:4-amino-4-deoxy-L-arabinose transferase-like glycosyltransferase